MVRKIDAGFEKMGSEGMPQQMRMNRFRKARLSPRFLASQEHCFGRDGPARIGAGKQPACGPPGSPIAAQQFQQFGRQQSLSILPSFAAADPQHVARAVDVARFELGDFRDSKSGTVQDRQHGALTKIARCFQQRFHFLAA